MSRKKPVRVPQSEYLPVVYEVGGVAGLYDVAEFFNVHPGTARRMLDGLVHQGLLTVEPGQEVRLRTYTLTDEGRARVEQEERPDADGTDK